MKPDLNGSKRRQKSNLLSRLSKVLFLSWLICLIVCTFLLGYFLFVLGQLLNEVGSTLALLFLGTAGLGCLSFGIAALLQVGSSEYGKKFWLLRCIGALCVYPLYLIAKNIKSIISSGRLSLSRLGIVVISFLVILPAWLVGCFMVATISLKVAGLSVEIDPITMNSMYPTIPDGTMVKKHTYKTIFYKINPNWVYEINRGDIISFTNERVVHLTELGGANFHTMLKRVIGLPGDKITLRGGVVFLNEKPLEEPYTAEANKTFALSGEFKGEMFGFMKNCEDVIVPEGKLFVLGDNREHSDDSRILGFVDYNDVIGYLTWEEQHQTYYHGVNAINHSEKWRDTSEDLSADALDMASTECAGK